MEYREQNGPQSPHITIAIVQICILYSIFTPKRKGIFPLNHTSFFFLLPQVRFIQQKEQKVGHHEYFFSQWTTFVLRILGQHMELTTFIGSELRPKEGCTLLLFAMTTHCRVITYCVAANREPWPRRRQNWRRWIVRLQSGTFDSNNQVSHSSLGFDRTALQLHQPFLSVVATLKFSICV